MLNEGESRRIDNERGWGRGGSNDPSIHPVSEETSPVRVTLGATQVNDPTALGLDPGTMPMITKHTHTQTHTQSSSGFYETCTFIYIAFIAHYQNTYMKKANCHEWLIQCE